MSLLRRRLRADQDCQKPLLLITQPHRHMFKWLSELWSFSHQTCFGAGRKRWFCESIKCTRRTRPRLDLWRRSWFISLGVECGGQDWASFLAMTTLSDGKPGAFGLCEALTLPLIISGPMESVLHGAVLSAVGPSFKGLWSQTGVELETALEKRSFR